MQMMANKAQWGNSIFESGAINRATTESPGSGKDDFSLGDDGEESEDWQDEFEIRNKLLLDQIDDEERAGLPTDVQEFLREHKLQHLESLLEPLKLEGLSHFSKINPKDLQALLGPDLLTEAETLCDAFSKL